MDRERDIIHKILDGDVNEQEKRSMARSMETDPDVRNDVIGITNAVRMLEQSARHEAPDSFTAEVMKKLPQDQPTLLNRVRDFLFGSRVLRWNIATALATVVVVIVTSIVVFRVSRETTAHTTGQAETAVLVRLTFYSPQAHSVAVAGDFNKWKTNADELRKSDGIWSIDLKLKPGVYTYSFIVDGQSWVPDPGAESYKDDGFGSRNAVLRVSI